MNGSMKMPEVLGVHVEYLIVTVRSCSSVECVCLWLLTYHPSAPSLNVEVNAALEHFAHLQVVRTIGIHVRRTVATGPSKCRAVRDNGVDERRSQEVSEFNRSGAARNGTLGNDRLNGETLGRLAEGGISAFEGIRQRR